VWMERIDESTRKFFEDGDARALTPVLRDWVSEILSDRGYAERFGSKKGRKETYILGKLIEYLKKPGARETPDLYAELLSITLQNARIQVAIVPLGLGPADEDETEDRWLEAIEPPRDPSELTHEEIAAIIREFHDLEAAVTRRGGMFDYLKLLPRSHPLWLLAGIFSSKKLDEFAVFLHRVAGRTVVFPGIKKYRDANVRIFLRGKLDFKGTTYEDLTREINRKFGYDYTAQRVGILFREEKKRKMPGLDDEIKHRDFISKAYSLLAKNRCPK